MKLRAILLIFIFQQYRLHAQQDCGADRHSVLFGERSTMMEAPADNTVRVFMDQSGFYYPDLYIKDKELEKNCSSLKQWYKANPRKLDLLCDQYHVTKSTSADEKINCLNDSIAKSYVRAINQKIKNYKIIDLLIHGFRKKAYGDAGAGSSYSTSDFGRFEGTLSKYASAEILFVEIYWDGKFITPVQSYKYRGFRLFEKYAIPDAENVGLQLRRLVPYIQSDNINIVTHSLGAMVGCELLFNATKGALTDEKILPTPAQKKIKICLIEPAIGAELFDEYYSRNTTLDFKHSDNYKLAIVYNNNDFVLLKSYNWRFVHIVSSPLEYGNTSLGCNYGDCIATLKKQFAGQYPNSTLTEPFDFSEVGADHRLYVYSRSKAFIKVMDFLNGG